mgnify:CR=1 FL=1
MRYTLTIDMDNAAFTDDGNDGQTELARILRDHADRIDRGQLPAGPTCVVRDLNGNDVGRAKIHPE